MNWLFLPVFIPGVLLTCPVSLGAAPPILNNMNPRGAERAKAVSLVVTGANLTSQTRLLLPFKATQTLLPDPKPNPAQVHIQLTIDPTTPLGIYPVRAATEEGVSAFFLFSVDAFPNVNEIEDNSTFEKAQKVSLPVIITGQCAGGDVDFFRFAARKGQRLVIETEAARLGSGVVPQLRLTDAARRFLAADDTQALRGDCRIVFVPPADGDYIVEISDARYRGGAPPHYRLKIAEYDVIEEIFPLGGRRGEVVEFTLRGGTLSSEVRIRRTLTDPENTGVMLLPLDGVVRPGMLSPEVVVDDLPERRWRKSGGKDPRTLDVLPPIAIDSRLEHRGDSDRFQFPVQAGQRYRLAVQAETLGSLLDGVLRVTDQAGNQLARVDDVDLPLGRLAAIRTADPTVEVTVPPNVTLLKVELRDQRSRGGVNFVYRLTIQPAMADFIVHQPVAEINVPRGGSAALVVAVTRRGYSGPLQLVVPTLPPGLSVQGGHVAANATVGVLTLSADAVDPPAAGPEFLHLEGQARSAGLLLRRRGEQKIVLGRDSRPASSLLTLGQFVVGRTGPEPFALQGPAAIEVVQGYPTVVPIGVTRARDQEALAIEVLAMPIPPVPGQPALAVPFPFKPVTVAPGVVSASIALTVAGTTPEGTLDLVIQGNAKVNNAARTAVGPAVTVTVRRPFQVEMLTTRLAVVAGQRVALKGRLVRQPIFKETVQLKLDGLPQGVTLAMPLAPIAANANDFQIDLQVDPKTTPFVGTLSLTCSTTIGGMTVALPPVSIPFQVTAGSLK